MQIRIFTYSLHRGLWWLLFFIFTLASTLLSMGIAFFGVAYFMEDVFVVERIEARKIEQAGILRRQVNALLTLSEDYLERLPLSASTPKLAVAQYIQRDFRPALRAHKHRLEQKDQHEALHAFGLDNEWRKVYDRAIAMASHPADTLLRRRAMQDILLLAKEAERLLRAQGLAPYLNEPAVLPQFEKKWRIDPKTGSFAASS